MKPCDFLQFVARFAEQAVPSTLYRHVYLWIGEANDLISNSPAGLFKVLDLHLLCQKIEKTPFGDKAASRQLSLAIEDWLLKEFPRDQRQRALLVTGVDLIYRYRMPLSGFMQLASENRMVVLAISDQDVYYHPIKNLPSYVQFTPDSMLKYLQTGMPEEAVIRRE